MIPFKIGTKEIELPTHHGEITLRQFLVLRSQKEIDFNSALCLFTGISEDELYSCSDFDLDQKIWPHLEWVKEEFDYSQFPLPPEVKVGRKYFKVPSVYESTYGQKVVFQGIFEKCMNDGIEFIDRYDEIIAIYVYPLLKGKFNKDYSKDSFVMNHILNMRIDEALPLASFFLSSYNRLLTLNQENFHTILNKKRSVLALIGSKSSVIFRPFMPLRKAILRSLTKCLKWITTRSLSHSGMKQKVQGSSVG